LLIQKLLSKNGLLQRFIPVVLQNKFNKVGVPIDEGQGKVKEWEAAIRNVYAIKRLKYTLSITLLIQLVISSK
jgi:hypothetical protein